jgi:ADP-ribose pyrophosphatase
LGKWLVLPLLDLAGSKQTADDAFNEIFHPFAERLLEKCDAVLRVGGESTGAEMMVKIGQKHGLQIIGI